MKPIVFLLLNIFEEKAEPISSLSFRFRHLIYDIDSGSQIPVEWEIRRMTMELVWQGLNGQYLSDFNDLGVILKPFFKAIEIHQDH